MNPRPTVYIPFTQVARPWGGIVVRTEVSPLSIVPEVRRRLSRLNPAVPLIGFQTLDERIHDSLAEPRFYTMMASACAAMAVLFVTLGLYGLVSLSVSRRTAEFGIRMAVGAEQTAIRRMVLRQGARMTAVGVATGIVFSVSVTRVLQSLLFEVEPIDPWTLGPAVLVVVVVTLVASYVPARRASRVDPVVALRHE